MIKSFEEDERFYLKSKEFKLQVLATLNVSNIEKVSKKNNDIISIVYY